MVANLIKGKEIALALREKLGQEIASRGDRPHLAVILVGDDEASLIYDRNKQKAAIAAGMDCDLHHLPEETSEAEVLALIERLNEDKNIHGVMVQLPLPKHIDSRNVIEHIKPEKDVDGFTPQNAGLLSVKDERAIVSATPAGILYLLKTVHPSCTVTVVHSKTHNLPEITKQADILIAACGKAKMVKADWVKEGATVIDVGINRIDGKLCGDVDFDEVVNKAAHITPVPGGVGPMTIAMLLENTYQAYRQSKA